MAYFSIDDLTIGYHKVPVIRNISLEVRKGEIIALIGPMQVVGRVLLMVGSGTSPPSSSAPESTLPSRSQWRCWRPASATSTG